MIGRFVKWISIVIIISWSLICHPHWFLSPSIFIIVLFNVRKLHSKACVCVKAYARQCAPFNKITISMHAPFVCIAFVRVWRIRIVFFCIHYINEVYLYGTLYHEQFWIAPTEHQFCCIYLTTHKQTYIRRAR